MVNTTTARLHDFNSVDEFFSQKVLYLYVDPAQRKEVSAELLEKGFVSGKEVYFDSSVIDITERKRMEAEIIALSIIDQLTGLYNRRGFLSLAEHQLKSEKPGVQTFNQRRLLLL